MKLIKRHLFGGILNSLKQFLNPKYSIDEVPTGPTPPVKGWYKLPLMEVDKPLDTKTYNGGTLPGVTISAINLSKPLPFPYGGINVVSKSINKGLGKKQRVFVNPFDKSYLASNYKEGGLIRKHQFGGSNKSNRFISSGISNIPEINVNGIDRRWRLSKRGQNHGNGHGVTSEYFYDYYDGGNHYLGDNAVIKGGRTIYTSPKGNDTLYWNNPSKWIWYQHGLMPVGGNLTGAKKNFFKNLKRPLIKNQEGGPIEMADNTRVASGKPLIDRRYPRSGPRKDELDWNSPMILFNNPYVLAAMIAMGPIVGRFKPGETPSQHPNGIKLAPTTMKDIINLLNLINLVPKAPDNTRAMGIGVTSLSRMAKKTPMQVIETMYPKFGGPKLIGPSDKGGIYGWTFENPDHYRLALLLFNLK